ncbi:hypothetical protein HT746_21010 [Burkholderia pyrrocinia]|uniref:papain-like cysteine protease family protein n=1 Tax=Burkholderia pyrrocinia TaxID=60550 RepID=UPI001575D4A0|nr:papain-like cysteine protease family protein [Burkholderia pyrrocinia]NTX29572.1 hypothetical protein [Burkholderia pyrrocinia]QVN19279.1 hypothetical protein JYG32_05995 [Burkholderia pyrrocinia]
MNRPNYRILDVPLVGQRKNSDGTWLMLEKGNEGLQPHGDRACWYAAVCMVSYYRRPGPRRGLPKIWLKDQGLPLTSISELAKVEGLVPLKRPDEVTAEWLEDVLKKHGPIWAGGAFRGTAHAIVVTGVQDTTVFYNDPWEPRAKVTPIKLFDRQLGRYKGCLLVKGSLDEYY